LREVERWLRSEAWRTDPTRQVFRLFGYAGTGKTTLAKHLAGGVEGRVVFAAYTGKAAHVLRQKGCPASTLHSAIYKPRERGAGRTKELEEQLKLALSTQLALGPEPPPAMAGTLTLRSPQHLAAEREIKVIEELLGSEKRAARRPLFTLSEDSDLQGAKLAVIDECSMVDEQMGVDLESFGVPILVLGDPMQLPPVGGGGHFTGTEKRPVTPDVLLDEVHRQAVDSPILWLATQVRYGNRVSVGKVGEGCCVVPYGTPELRDVAQHADQILVGRNVTRHASNARYRQLMGMDAQPTPLPGDKLVCLRNDNEVGLLNGSLWRVHEAEHDAAGERMIMNISSEEEGPNGVSVEAHDAHFLGRERDMPWWERKEKQEFDYGYALTVHKAQGSQWDDVMLFNESAAFREHRQRWLYTGITRAAKSLTIVQE